MRIVTYYPSSWCGPVAAGLMALCLAASLPATAQEQEDRPEKDPETGFVMADGWETVRANCTSCHSAMLVTQNRGSRAHWKSLIRWMQDTQGLWELPEEDEATILDYLAEYYGPKDASRRQPLSPRDLPDNPYKQDSQKTTD